MRSHYESNVSSEEGNLVGKIPGYGTFTFRSRHFVQARRMRLPDCSDLLRARLGLLVALLELDGR